MKVNFIAVTFVGILLILLFVAFVSGQKSPQNRAQEVIDRKEASEEKEEVPAESVVPTDEEAELVAFGFIQNFIASAPPEIDAQAQEEAYEALSESAKSHVSGDNLSRDLAAFVGVQDVPDRGASIEDLQITENIATLIVGLNYSGSGRILKAVNMIIETGEWKVDSIETLQNYPLEE